MALPATQARKSLMQEFITEYGTAYGLDFGMRALLG